MAGVGLPIGVVRRLGNISPRSQFSLVEFVVITLLRGAY
jgi:hypothetical protein